ncbi:hypothetical protein AB205_0216600 [Aquarana catesbeiana]|uniref:UBZ4-type domain-containing protein n=1 Tax=Aquarana catesbeiana TaxID=8400 RepID=A0A2G9S9S2_AQUCT|nr:hypothetical protein AB205_0216600 [Aquarana catesbeiana]
MELTGTMSHTRSIYCLMWGVWTHIFQSLFLGRLEKCYLCKSLVPIKDYQTHVDKCLQSAAQETQGTQMLKGSKSRGLNLTDITLQSHQHNDVENLQQQLYERYLFLTAMSPTSLAGNRTRRQTPNHAGAVRVHLNSAARYFRDPPELSSPLRALQRGDCTEDENNSALDFSGMSPPREEQAGSFSSSHLSISDSPIRSFVSISEIKDCLVDFKKQLSRPPKHQPNKKRPQHRGKRRRM